MNRKNQTINTNKKTKTRHPQFEITGNPKMPFIVSNELNFPFLINLKKVEKNHLNHH